LEVEVSICLSPPSLFLLFVTCNICLDIENIAERNGMNVAVSGAVCASTLAKNGISVTLFESARGPGGRMSQRR